MRFLAPVNPKMAPSLVFEVESAPVTAFPARLQCRRADFDFVVGYGQERGLDPIEIEPVVSTEWLR